MSLNRTIAGIFVLAAIWDAAGAVKLPSLTVPQVTYSNVIIVNVSATDIYFTHDRGIGNVKLKYLSPDLQKMFNFDPRAAAEAERKQLEAEALYASNLASNMTRQASNASNDNTGRPRPILADPVSDKSLLGKTAPRLEVDSWVREKPVLDGKYLLITFWAPWSNASRQSVPELNSLQKRFADKLVVVGVSTNAEAEVAQMTDPKLEFPAATDSKGKLSTAAGVTSIPTVLLVDAKGVVRYEGHPAALTENRLESLFTQDAE